jgi:tRNA pseudouridine38-40 synthase
MRNIKLLLSYDGSAYHGWERQRDCRTLQQTLEEAIQSLTGESTRVVASGRTDSGVHALGHVANFTTNTRHECTTIHRALNAILPDDFRVLHASEADPAFHARYSAKQKLYRYVMCDRPLVNPLLRHFVVQWDQALDLVAMRQAAQVLHGRHDFSSFETSGAPRSTSIRTISHIAVFRDGPAWIWSRVARAGDSGKQTDGQNGFGSLLFLEVAADGFLYNMVRSIAGTLLNIGRGYRTAESMKGILDARDRGLAGPTAPAHGLFLVRVDY